MPNQLGVIQLKGLVKELPVLFLPLGHRRIERLEDVLDLTMGRGTKPAAISSIKIDDLLCAHPHVGYFTTCVSPEFDSRGPTRRWIPL